MARVLNNPNLAIGTVAHRWVQDGTTDVRGGRLVDTVRTEQVEADLDRLVTKRHDYRIAEEGHRPSEEMYEEGCRRYAEEERKGKLIDRYLYHEEHIVRLDRTFGVLRAEHEAQRDRAAVALLAYGVVAKTLLENGHKESA